MRFSRLLGLAVLTIPTMLSAQTVHSGGEVADAIVKASYGDLLTRNGGRPFDPYSPPSDPRITTSISGIQKGLSKIGPRLVSIAGRASWPIFIATTLYEHKDELAPMTFSLVQGLSGWENAKLTVGNDGLISIAGAPSASNGANLPDSSGLTYPSIWSSNSEGIFYYRSGNLPYTIRKFSKFSFSCVMPVAEGDPPCAKPALYNGSLTEDMLSIHTGGSQNGTIAYWSLRYSQGNTDNVNGMRRWDFLYEFQPRSDSPVSVPDTLLENISPAELDSYLPIEVLDTDLSDEAIAALATAAFVNSEPIPFGLAPGQSVKTETVAQAITERPKVRDLFTWSNSANSNSTGELVTSPPVALPPENPVTPGSGLEVDLGDDPNISAPEIPVENDPFAPIKNLIPEQINFQIPDGTCPIFEFNVFNKDLVIDAQCDLAEQQRPAIQLISLVMYSIIAFFIILRA